MPIFEEELRTWGPESLSERAASLAQAEAYCRNLARGHYENFPIVSWLLPARLHQHFFNLYAYCRWSDDLGDEVEEAERSLSLLSWWKGELADCYAGRARHPVFVALRKTIEECQIPPEPFEDLICAFEQDQRVCEYETFFELKEYCRRSADPVGRLVLYVCGEQCERNVKWSDSICTGLQLANFWQDVGRDYDMGRVYLPAEDRKRFGYTCEDLRDRRTNPAFLELMRFEVDRAREFLLAGLPLIEHLPGRLQVDVDLFARGGLEILKRIEASGYRVWNRRPVVTRRDLAGLFAGCIGRAIGRPLGFFRVAVSPRPPLSASPRLRVSLDESYSWCKAISRRRARNFYFSFLTLPSEQLRDMCALYAFMRVADDLGDDDRLSIEQRAEKLTAWRDGLQRALAGDPAAHPVFPALVRVVRKYEIPHEYLFAVIEGVRTDLEPTGFETFEELTDYCYHVAGAVGLCCIYIWGFHDKRALECAVECGIAFQLTNILRDLGEDIKMGRVYLPETDLQAFGYTASDIADHCRDERFLRLMRFEVDRARIYYQKAEKLFDYLKPQGKPIFSAMLRIYRGLLDEIERRDYDVFSRRIQLPAWRKLLIAVAAAARFRCPAWPVCCSRSRSAGAGKTKHPRRSV